MKLEVLNLENEKSSSVTAPKQFEEPVRKDLVVRAVHAVQSHEEQPSGADERAGKKHSADLSRKRRDYRGSYGFGISRVPRKILSGRGMRLNWEGAESPGTVGGRRAHPPKAEKKTDKKINKKERRKAIRSAMAATLNKDLVEERGHVVGKNYPFVVEDSIENLTKTKELFQTLKRLGFEKDLARGKKKKVRSGKGKSRGRKYKRKKSLLLVSSQNCPLERAASNLPGVDYTVVDELNAKTLAPGGHVGRVTVYTKSAIERLKKEELFT